MYLTYKRKQSAPDTFRVPYGVRQIRTYTCVVRVIQTRPFILGIVGVTL